MFFVSKYIELTEKDIQVITEEINDKYKAFVFDKNSIIILKYLDIANLKQLQESIGNLPFDLKLKALKYLKEKNNLMYYSFSNVSTALQLLGYNYKSSYGYFYKIATISRERTKEEQENYQKEVVELMMNNKILHDSLFNAKWKDDNYDCGLLLDNAFDWEEKLMFQYFDVKTKWHKTSAVAEVIEKVTCNDEFNCLLDMVADNYIANSYDYKSLDVKYFNYFDNNAPIPTAIKLANMLIDRDKIDFFTFYIAMKDKKTFERIVDKITSETYSTLVKFAAYFGKNLPISISRSSILKDFVRKNKDKLLFEITERYHNTIGIQYSTPTNIRAGLSFTSNIITEEIKKNLIYLINSKVNHFKYYAKYNNITKTAIKEFEQYMSIIGDILKEGEEVDEEIMKTLDIPFLYEQKIGLGIIEKKGII